MGALHIVIEAIDGAGKGTVIKGLCDAFAQRAIPVLSVCEPSHVGMGAVIRQELTKKHEDGHSYPATVAAEAFAIDRTILYTTVIIPRKQQDTKGIILQDRSLLSSLTYQPLQDPKITTEYLLSLYGNQLEAAHAPNILIILNLAPEEAQRRLSGRVGKDDQSVFEEPTFQEKLAARYQDPELRKIFTEHGTVILDINAQQTPEKVIQDTLDALESHLHTL
jgi:dTMP kinase